MHTRLTETERKLLAAYSDGELSGSDQSGAEAILEQRPEARAYVRELRALHELSTAAFPAVPTSSLPGTFGTKLTSSAIRTAARGAASGSTAGMSGWGMAATALAATAAVVVIVSAVVLRQPAEPRATPVADRTATTAQTPVAAVRLEPDSSSLVVPAMSSQELMDFALTGRVPIDEGRQKYLTVGADSTGSISLAVRPRDRAPVLRASLDLAGVPGFDSIGHALRTSALQAPSHGLAVRTDLPSLRLRAIQRLDETMPQLPENVRRELENVRAELEGQIAGLRMAVRHRAESARPEREAGDGNAVQYVVLAPRPSHTTESPTGDRPPAGYFAGLREVEIDRQDLGSLESFVRQEPVVTVAGSGRNGQVVARGFSRRWPEPVQVGGPPPQDFGRPRRPVVIELDGGNGFVRFGTVDLDSMMRMTDETLEKTDQILRQADSIRRAVHERRRLMQSRPDTQTVQRQQQQQHDDGSPEPTEPSDH